VDFSVPASKYCDNAFLIIKYLSYCSTSESLRNGTHRRINHKKKVGIDVLAAEYIKRIIFSQVTPCSPIEVHGRFGETYCFLIQGRKVSQEARHRQQIYSSVFSTEDFGEIFFRNFGEILWDHTASRPEKL
jgi:hypothetical protein